MRRILPKFKDTSAFTLIELMVVVAIIAILAVVGFAIFQNAQKNARDGIRRGEINNLAKSIESSKDPTVANYTYTLTNFTADYPTNKPRDPLKSATDQQYCVLTNASNPVDNPASWLAGLVCPTGWAYIVNDTGAYNTTTALNATIKHWKICTRLEVPTTNNIFCIGNSQ